VKFLRMHMLKPAEIRLAHKNINTNTCSNGTQAFLASRATSDIQHRTWRVTSSVTLHTCFALITVLRVVWHLTI